MIVKQYSIGAFSEKTGISKRMLRHYDKLNLFCPIHINEDNGYRYYMEEQEDDLLKIQMLQQMGFTLSEVKEILEAPIELNSFLDALKGKEVDLTQKSDEIKTSLMMIKRFIGLLNKDQSKTFPDVNRLLDQERSIQMTKTSRKSVKVELKGLLNRDMFFERVEEILQEDQNDDYHFISFDIDQFMSVNDNDGYEVGDAVIVKVVELIYKNMKSLLDQDLSANLIARLGGDETSLFLKNKTDETIRQHIDMVFESVRAFDFKQIGCSKQVTVSCGAVSMKRPDHYAKLEDLSSRALVDAKRNGRDQYIFMNIHR